MQLAVDSQVLGDLGAEDFQGAAVVAQVYAAQVTNDPVGDAARDFAEEGTILAVDALANDEVPLITVPDEGQHGGQVGRVVLEVTVHGSDEIAPGHVDARHQGEALAVVLAELHDDEAGVVDTLQFPDGPVGAPVVHVDDLVLHLPRQGGVDPVDEGADVLALVVNGDYYG